MSKSHNPVVGIVHFHVVTMLRSGSGLVKAQKPLKVRDKIMFWLMVLGFVATNTARKCCDISLKIFSVVTTDTVGKCLSVSLKLPGFVG